MASRGTLNQACQYCESLSAKGDTSAYGSPDKTGVHGGGYDTDGGGLLLLGLTTGATDPSEDERVDCIGADGETERLELGKSTGGHGQD